AAKGEPPKQSLRKLTSYLVFYLSFKNGAKAAQPPLNGKEISKNCSEKWRAMSREEKKKYQDMAKQHNAQRATTRRSDPLRGVRRRQRKRQRKSLAPKKRPLPAFFLFAANHRPGLRECHPRWTAVETVKELGKMWHQQPEKDKTRYKEQAALNIIFMEFNAAFVVAAKGKMSKKLPASSTGENWLEKAALRPPAIFKEGSLKDQDS
uniref:High mobility group box 4 n=1 Tax=Nothoprocta perdicaria TaxID=30464 RepID=A0A8C6ZDA7_NOTPE